MKNTILLILSLFFISSSCVELLDELGLQASVERTIDRIKSQYMGVIIAKYSTRPKLAPTHLRIVTTKNDTIELSPNSAITNFVEIGDTIIKFRNENTVQIKKISKEVKQFYYIRISQEVRNNKDFPVEWKNKWLDSTEYWTD